MLERLARWSYRRRWTMLGLWVVALIGFPLLSSNFGGDYSQNFSLPGADSQKAYDLLKDRFPEQAGETADIVFQADRRVTDPAVVETMEGLFAELTTVEHVIGLDSPYAEGARQISEDGTIAFATLRFENLDGESVPVEVGQRILELADAAENDAVTIEPGGMVIQFAEFEEPSGAEGVGLLAAVFILLVTFGSVLAMGLPIMMALFGITIGLALVFLFANFLDVPDFAPQLTMMIGIGVGIDYALFIVTRYRQQLDHGLDPESATVVAIKTAGKAVLFAGTTVVISLLGMLLMGFAFVEGVAVGGAAAVAVTMLASVTLLPAVLGFVRHRIDKWKLPWFHRESHRFEDTVSYRWSRTIQRRPLPMAIIGLGLLVLLTLPVFSIRLGFADAGTGSVERSSRRAYDLLSQGFGPGFNGPLLLAAEIDGAQDLAAMERVGQALATTEGIVAATAPFPNQAGTAAVLTAFPATSPQDEATTALVTRVRDDVVPRALAGADVEINVGGFTSSIVDFSEANASRLPILIGVVLLLSFLLLVAVFRSLVVPIKAVIMNLLSIGAAYGVVVAIFQWGWGKGLLGVESTAPIEAWVPMMLFTILFGLSMDYEIFLLSRIREEYLRTGDNATAVANGLAHTARVISAAAAIMVALFLAFVFGFDERSIKLFGMGLAVAIFVDATIVRMVLVPATMELLGDRNWWLPRWLDRILPNIHIEGEAEVVQDALEERELEAAGASTPDPTRA
ncbi:MAG: MMPL family transporter [Actinomycetota bacterium]